MWRSAAQSWFCAPTACKRPALNFIVSVRRDCFARPEESRPIRAREFGFPDQPLTRRGGIREKQRGSEPHLLPSTPLSHLLSSPLLSCPSTFSPLLSPSYIFLPHPHLLFLLSCCKEKSAHILQLILTKSRACVYTGSCGLHLFLLAVFLENRHLKSRFFKCMSECMCVCVYVCVCVCVFLFYI